jgi:hypothetical protein
VVRMRFPHLLGDYDTPHKWQVDLQEADPATFDVELIKYLLKDWSESKLGERIAPGAFGRILKALDGTRMRQGAAGWMAIAESRRDVALCRECGTIVVSEVRRVDRSPRGVEGHHGCEASGHGIEIRPPPPGALPRIGDQLHF